nr:translation initiation factor eIF-1 - rabbit (fragments) [Oryctolagus cuniculus]
DDLLPAGTEEVIQLQGDPFA